MEQTVRGVALWSPPVDPGRMVYRTEPLKAGPRREKDHCLTNGGEHDIVMDLCEVTQFWGRLL